MEEFIAYRRGEFAVFTDPAKIDQGAVFRFMEDTFWAKRRPREVTARALKNSLCFSLYHHERQVGVARVVTDYATFAYLCDVCIEKAYRGQGLGRWLMECIMAYSQLQNLSWCLLTGTNHDFYKQFGFRSLRKPQHYLEKRYTW